MGNDIKKLLSAADMDIDEIVLYYTGMGFDMDVDEVLSILGSEVQLFRKIQKKHLLMTKKWPMIPI